jgi:hypothetical protein
MKITGWRIMEKLKQGHLLQVWNVQRTQNTYRTTWPQEESGWTPINEESYKVQEWRTKKKLGAKKGLGKVKKPPCFRIQADSWGIKIQDIEELQGEQEHNHSKQMRWPRPWWIKSRRDPSGMRKPRPKKDGQ